MCPNKDWAKHWFREPKKPVLLWDGSWQTGRNQSSHCFALFSLGGCQLQFSLGKHCKSLEQSLLFSYNYMGCPLGGKKKICQSKCLVDLTLNRHGEGWTWPPKCSCVSLFVWLLSLTLVCSFAFMSWDPMRWLCLKSCPCFSGGPGGYLRRLPPA